MRSQMAVRIATGGLRTPVRASGVTARLPSFGNRLLTH